jgi:hypothetical protein
MATMRDARSPSAREENGNILDAWSIRAELA